MLQQTTVAHATPYFLRFTERWPTVNDLAAAEDADVMAAWAGLGYYARARNLLACARAVAARGGFPDTRAGLAALLLQFNPESTVVFCNMRRDTEDVVMDRAWQVECFEFREKHLLETAAQRMRRADRGTEAAQFAAFNDVQDHLLLAAPQAGVEPAVAQQLLVGAAADDPGVGVVEQLAPVREGVRLPVRLVLAVDVRARVTGQVRPRRGTLVPR